MDCGYGSSTMGSFAALSRGYEYSDGYSYGGGNGCGNSYVYRDGGGYRDGHDFPLLLPLYELPVLS